MLLKRPKAIFQRSNNLVWSYFYLLAFSSFFFFFYYRRFVFKTDIKLANISPRVLTIRQGTEILYKMKFWTRIITYHYFIQAFKIVVDTWKFSMILLYILWDDWPIFMISASNEQLQQLEYTLLKPDCHSLWISKMQSGHEDILEERYAIKLCFKLGKNATETYGMHQTAFGPFTWVEHQFLSGIRDSRKAGSLWEMMRGAGGVRKSID